MATRLYTIGPDARLGNVIEGVGAATSSANLINLTIDLANTLVKDGATASGTRSVSKNEILLAIETLEQYIVRGNWPPA